MNKITTEYEWESPDVDVEESVIVTVEATITDYHPAVMYLSNGDPGYPAEGGEIEDITITGPDGKVWDNDTPTHVTKMVSDYDENLGPYRGSMSMRWENTTVPLRKAVEDVIINATEELAW